MKPFEQATQSELRALWEEKYPQEIVPAEPLTEPLGIGERYYTESEGECTIWLWDDDELDNRHLKHKNVFPYTPEGKAGAELRAKIPHPGLHWQEDVMALRETVESLGNGPFRNSVIIKQLESFLNKYS